MEVGRSLSEIDAKVKELNASLKESTEQTRLMDRALKLDPKATEITTQRIKTLKTAIGEATQKVALLKQKQIEVNKAFEDGQVGEAEYQRIAKAVMRAENELRRFNAQLKNAEKTRLKTVANEFNKVTSALNKTQSAARALSRLMMGLVGVVGGLVTTFMKQTNELNEMASAYDMSIEKLQLQRNLYKQVTGNADNYNNTLNSLKNTLNKITLGQGQSYANLLKYLGVETVGLDGKTKSLDQMYDEIVEALGGMEDIMLRNQIAYELFGEEAISVLEMLELTTEQIDELNQKAIEQGIITEENARTAEEIQAAWDAVKQEFMQVSMELATALLPLIKSLSEFMIQFIIPILTTIANWFAGMNPQQQKFMVFLIFLVIMLPMIIKFITIVVAIIKAITIACYAASGGVAAVSAAATPLIPILLAVVAVVLVLVILFAFLSGRSKELSKTMESQKKSMGGMASSYEDIGSDMSVNSNQVSHNNNSSTQEINVTIDSRGDNPIATENAELVADLLAERINKELGGKI